MKTNRVIKKLLPIIFLLLLLFLVPLFKPSIEYFCDFNMNNISPSVKNNCERYFTDEYTNMGGNIDDIINASGNSDDCLSKITVLKDILNMWLQIRNQTPDDSECELAVINEKITSITDIIKLKLIMKDECDIGYNLESPYYGEISLITDDSIKNNLLKYIISNPVDNSEKTKMEEIMELAGTCELQTLDTAPGECCIEGNDLYDISDYQYHAPTTYDISEHTSDLCSR